MNILTYTRHTNMTCAALLLLVAHLSHEQHGLDSSLGWIIFACMYATMDGYNRRDNLTVYRAIAGTVGVLACVLLCGHYAGGAS